MRVGGRVSGLLEKVVRSPWIIPRHYIIHVLTLAPCFYSHLPENRQSLHTVSKRLIAYQNLVVTGKYASLAFRKLPAMSLTRKFRGGHRRVEGEILRVRP